MTTNQLFPFNKLSLEHTLSYPQNVNLAMLSYFYSLFLHTYASAYVKHKYRKHATTVRFSMWRLRSYITRNEKRVQ